jgi:hypothetical protein
MVRPSLPFSPFSLFCSHTDLAFETRRVPPRDGRDLRSRRLHRVSEQVRRPRPRSARHPPRRAVSVVQGELLQQQGELRQGALSVLLLSLYLRFSDVRRFVDRDESDALARRTLTGPFPTRPPHGRLDHHRQLARVLRLPPEQRRPHLVLV